MFPRYALVDISIETETIFRLQTLLRLEVEKKFHNIKILPPVNSEADPNVTRSVHSSQFRTGLLFVHYLEISRTCRPLRYGLSKR